MRKHFKILLTALITVLLLLGFAVPANMVGNWTQQFMPNIGGRQISDIFFLDSLNGWAVTPSLGQNDTAYVLRTTNGGTNWFIQFTRTGQFVGYYKVKFLDLNTGYICGVSQYNGEKGLQKTTNGGGMDIFKCTGCFSYLF